MEELLATVTSSNVRDYMREAMNCYMAGAYRGCIVLSYIALFDDLLAKLSTLGKVNKIAKKIHDDASKKKSDQEVYESYLIDQLDSNTLLSGLDTSFLKTLRTLRNKSAHPSGHIPSPEEARFIFFEVINRFLSQAILSTTQLVDEIIARLKNKNFFPTTQIQDIKEVVEEEIKSLHKEAFPQLISKLTDEVISRDVDTSMNAGFFLTGLASLDKPELNSPIQKKIIQSKSDDSDYYQLILRLISSNGKLFIGLNKASRTRFKRIFKERIDNVKASVSDTKFSHPIAVFISLSGVLSDDELVDEFQNEISNLFKQKPYSNYLIDRISSLPKTGEIYLSAIKKKAGSNSFQTANNFAESLEDIDKNLFKLVSNKDAFEIIIAVLQAAKNGAFDAEGMKDTKFARAPKIRSKAAKYANSNKQKAKKYIKDKLYLDMKATDFVEEYLKDPK